MRLFRSLIAKKRPDRQAAPSRPCQPVEAVNIIGDIHGCVGLLETLLGKLEATEIIVTVGDYVDRGEHSRDVLTLLHDRQTKNPDRFICLMGNHEVMMLQFLDDPVQKGGRWLRNGGLQTLASFGVSGVKEIMTPEELVDASRAFKAKIPDSLESWLRNLPLSWSSENLFVTHAAADPDLPTAAQDSRVMLWGHPNFLRQPRSDDVWVAHGHTVIDPPEQSQSRISVDTGAYHSGRLTAARCLPTGEVHFLQATVS